MNPDEHLSALRYYEEQIIRAHAVPSVLVGQPRRVICTNCPPPKLGLVRENDPPALPEYCAQCDHKGWTYHRDSCSCEICRAEWPTPVNPAVTFQPQSRTKGLKIVHDPTSWELEKYAKMDYPAEPTWHNPPSRRKLEKAPREALERPLPVPEIFYRSLRAGVTAAVATIPLAFLTMGGFSLLMLFGVIAAAITSAGLRALAASTETLPPVPQPRTVAEIEQESAESWEIMKARRGQQRYPTLWGCTGCGYTFWSHGPEQDPEGDGHCQGGVWLADQRCINEVISRPFEEDDDGA